MAVLMAKCERIRQAYSDYKHLSTDNLSFVAGLRGRPFPAPVADVGSSKLRQRPKTVVPKGEDDEQDIEGSDELDDSALVSQVARQACPNRSCATRAQTLEALVEARVAAQVARHKAQLRLGLARENSQEAETKLEEAKAELIRMSEAIAEVEDRTEALRATLRNEGSINKGFSEELEMLQVEVMNLRREYMVDTAPPRPAAPIIPPDKADETFTHKEDGRSVEAPITAPGQRLQGQQHQQQRTTREGGAHGGGREWIHSGVLGHARISLSPQRSRSSKNSKNGSNHTDRPVTGSDARRARSGVASTASKVARDDKDSNGAVDAGNGREGTDERMTSYHAENNNRSEGEDVWSCCGKTFASAGHGCEPREPLATPEDLLLDTIDPRSRLGQPLDFRDFLPRTAWMSMSPDPVHPFAGSLSDGTLRPHTAPKSLVDAAGQCNQQRREGVGGGRKYFRRAARSRNGGLVGGVWASGGRRRRRVAGGLGVSPSPSPDGGVNAWWKNKTAQWGSGSLDSYGGASGGGGSRKGGELGGEGGGRESLSFPKLHDFLRRSHPTPTTATYASSRSAVPNGTSSRIPRPSGESKSKGNNTMNAAASTGSAATADEFWPRTQILGMNGLRLPREVRQAAIDRPLTAPCDKIGRRRVRTRSSRGTASTL